MVTRSEIFDHAEKTFGAKPDYPFNKYPHYAALRQPDDQKWFGLIMNVPREKLGLEGDGEVDVIDLKCHPAKVDNLKNKPGFLPAYYMNKEHWLTAVLDGSVSRKDVFALLQDSYELTKSIEPCRLNNPARIQLSLQEAPCADEGAGEISPHSLPPLRP